VARKSRSWLRNLCYLLGRSGSWIATAVPGAGRRVRDSVEVLNTTSGRSPRSSSIIEARAPYAGLNTVGTRDHTLRPENDPVRPRMRRFSRWSISAKVGHRDRASLRGRRHARAAPDRGVNHLQGNWQPARLLGHTKVGTQFATSALMSRTRSTSKGRSNRDRLLRLRDGKPDDPSIRLSCAHPDR